MSNTVIQIKRSLSNSQPPSLNVAELAYSYQSNTIFIGTPDGTGTIAIGGKAYLDIQNNIYQIVNAAYSQVNTSTTSSNAYAQAVGAAGNAYTVSVGASGNAYANVIGAASNTWANTVGTSGNAYTVAVGASGNAWANTVGTSGNAYTVAVGASGNDYTNLSTTSANNYAGAMANAANAYTSATYVKLVAGSQTITGDLAVTGNLTFLGNSTVISSNNLSVGDSLIYLAANNYSGTDLLDIGFVANYGNTTGANVHTGLVRDATDKTYYLFNGYDKEPANNTFVPYSNNMSLAVLNADIVTGNLWLSGANATVWIKSAYDTLNAGFTVANTAYSGLASANAWANAVGTSGNTYATVVGASGNAYANVVGTSGNAYAVVVGTSGNAYATVVGTSGNAYAVVVGASGNAYANVVGAASNTWANTLNTAIHNTFHDAANIISGTLSSGRLSGSYTDITGVGTITTGTWHGDTVNVGYGGTGIVSATLNGVLFGGGGNAAFQVTSAGIEGQVLTASATGVPQFSMISGGTF